MAADGTRSVLTSVSASWGSTASGSRIASMSSGLDQNSVGLVALAEQQPLGGLLCQSLGGQQDCCHGGAGEQVRRPGSVWTKQRCQAGDGEGVGGDGHQAQQDPDESAVDDQIEIEQPILQDREGERDG